MTQHKNVGSGSAYSYLLRLPFGYSEMMGSGYPNTPIVELRRALGAEFSRIQFKVDHLDENFYRIRIMTFGIQTAQNGEMDLVETVTGRRGDIFRLKYGQALIIGGPSDGAKSGADLLIRVCSCHSYSYESTT